MGLDPVTGIFSSIEATPGGATLIALMNDSCWTMSDRHN